MKAILLNGSRKEQYASGIAQEATLAGLKNLGWEPEAIMLREKNIAMCAGCFGCWVKAPGICVIDDFGRELAQKIVRSQLVVLLTPITFGGYSPELKKAVDRFVCSTLLPFFKRYKGELHHPPRYQHPPGLIGIGTLPHPDLESEDIFIRLVERNALNLHSKFHFSIITYDFEDQESVRQKIDAALKKVPE